MYRNELGGAISGDTGGAGIRVDGCARGRPMWRGVLQVPIAGVFAVQVDRLIDGYMLPLTRAHNLLLLRFAGSQAPCAWRERMLTYTCLEQQCASATDFVAVWYGCRNCRVSARQQGTQPQFGLCKLQQQQQQRGDRPLLHCSLSAETNAYQFWCLDVLCRYCLWSSP